MIITYIKIAFRNLVRQKTFAFTTLFGLGIGLATCILIFMFVKDK